jgi:predicted dehydrogenase
VPVRRCSRSFRGASWHRRTRRARTRRINIAGIGVGGQGWGDIQKFRNENIVALCDVDDQRAGEAFKALPDAKRFRDFRKMFDEMDNQIDAVWSPRRTIRTP